MPKRAAQPEKAYNNLEFLNSPEARIIRMMAEFLEPQRRFRRHGVRDTIVFFGSARMTPRKEALARLRRAEKEMAGVRRPARRVLREAEAAAMQAEMSRYYEDTVELARLLTQWSMKLPRPNRFVVASGGGPGIMEAANRGARLAGGKTIGLNISIPFEQASNPFVSPGLGFEFHYFFLRKFWFVYLAKALVIMPGGFGTMDELLEVLTLLQTGKIKKKMAVVVYGSEYWKSVLNLEELIRRGCVSRSDLALFTFKDDPRSAFEYLRSSLVRNYPTGETG
ncbi:MAG: LOG family protein [Bacteroidota bacterium]